MTHTSEAIWTSYCSLCRLHSKLRRTCSRLLLRIHLEWFCISTTVCTSSLTVRSSCYVYRWYSRALAETIWSSADLITSLIRRLTNLSNLVHDELRLLEWLCSLNFVSVVILLLNKGSSFATTFLLEPVDRIIPLIHSVRMHLLCLDKSVHLLHCTLRVVVGMLEVGVAQHLNRYI